MTGRAVRAPGGMSRSARQQPLPAPTPPPQPRPPHPAVTSSTAQTRPPASTCSSCVRWAKHSGVASICPYSQSQA